MEPTKILHPCLSVWYKVTVNIHNVFMKVRGEPKNRDILKGNNLITKHCLMSQTTLDIKIVLPFIVIVDNVLQVTSFHIHTAPHLFCILAVTFRNVDGGISVISCFMRFCLGSWNKNFALQMDKCKSKCSILRKDELQSTRMNHFNVLWGSNCPRSTTAFDCEFRSLVYKTNNPPLNCFRFGMAP